MICSHSSIVRFAYNPIIQRLQGLQSRLSCRWPCCVLIVLIEIFPNRRNWRWQFTIFGTSLATSYNKPSTNHCNSWPKLFHGGSKCILDWKAGGFRIALALHIDIENQKSRIKNQIPVFHQSSWQIETPMYHKTVTIKTLCAWNEEMCSNWI